MAKHITDAIAISCIDFRIQKHVQKWLLENLGEGKFDHVSLAGGVFDFYSILKQVELSVKLHEIKKVVLMNHEDCGAYGEAGNPERHTKDLQEAERKIEAIFPKVDVETYYVHLDGEFEEVSKTNPRG